MVETWNAAFEAVPAGSRAVSLGDNDIRTFKTAVREQLQGGDLTFKTLGGGTTAYTATLAVTPTAYVHGLMVRGKMPSTNAASPTLNVSGLGAIAMKKYGTGPGLVDAGDLISGSDHVWVYDSTDTCFYVMTPVASANMAAPNLLMNPALQVWPEGTSIAVGDTDGEYMAEGFQFRTLSAAPARWTAEQNTGGVNTRHKTLKLTNTTADTTVASGDIQAIQMKLEGQFAQALTASGGGVAANVFALDLKFTKGGGSSLTFPIKVALTARSYGGTSRRIASNVTLAADAVAQRVYVAFPADSTGNIVNTTAQGYSVEVALYGNANMAVAVNDTWETNSNDATKTTDSVNLADATGNILEIAAVKLEPGTVPTPFYYSGAEAAADLDFCLRYYERIQPATAEELICAGSTGASNAGTGVLPFRKKRVAPTITLTAANTFNWYEGDNTSQNPSVLSAANIGLQTAWLSATLTSAATGGGFLTRDNVDTTSISISARL